MKQIPLTKGRFAIVDDADFPALSKFKWQAAKGRYTYYAARSEWLRDEKRYRHIGMHREIVNAPDGMEVDHINLDGLDNRRSNLRVVTRAENGRNMKIPKSNTSGYKGVSPYRYNRKKWRAYINYNRRQIHLGIFDTAEEAHQARLDFIS